MRVLYLSDVRSAPSASAFAHGWNEVSPKDQVTCKVFDVTAPVATLIANFPESGALAKTASLPEPAHLPLALHRGRYFADLTNLVAGLKGTTERQLADSAPFGKALSLLYQTEHPVTVFLKQNLACDGGAGALEYLTSQVTPLRKLTDSGEKLRELSQWIRQSDLVLGVEGDIPFLGMDGWGPVLSHYLPGPMVAQQMRRATLFANDLTAAANQIERPHKQLLPAAGVNYRTPGSAGGGGLAGALGLLGARLYATKEVLSQHLNLAQTFQEADLVVVHSRELDYVTLPQSSLAQAGSLAQPFAIPVVAVAESSNLGRHDLTSYGIHGVMETPLVGAQLGIRLARTWAQN